MKATKGFMKHIIFILFLLLFAVPLLAQQDTGKVLVTETPSDQEYQEARKKLDRALQLVNRFYVDTVDFAMLAEKAIIEMLKNLDPHSNYFTAEQIRRANEGLEGSFQGVGVEYQIIDDTAVIMMVHHGGPASKAGIKPGDLLIAIDGEDAAGTHISNQWISKRVRGPGGTGVELTFIRRLEKAPIAITVIRGTISTHSLEAAFMLTDRTGYIRLNRFMRTTVSEFEEAVSSLRKQGMRRLVLDLRGNSGGYLMAAVELTDHFLPRNRLIVYTEGEHHPRLEYTSTSKGKFKRGKLVVLIDERSASASEIVTGAIQDWDRGVVVGRRTYGKGLVQKPYSFSDGSAVRLTIARYYTPLGRSIQRPYDEGRDKYYDELKQRIRAGEQISFDSLEIPDSLRFITPGGKTVYGGGGVMPDILVPADTTMSTGLLSTFNRHNLFNRFALHHISTQRDSLDRLFPDQDRYIANAQIVNEALPALYKFANIKGIEVPDTIPDEQQHAIEIRLQVTMARLLFGNAAAQETMSSYDPVILRAVQIIDGRKASDIWFSESDEEDAPDEENEL